MNAQSMEEYLLEHWEDVEQVHKHASYFALLNDKQQNELEVVDLFNRELKSQGLENFHSIVVRGSGKDPPDCEATGNGGGLMGIEVTE